MPFLAILGAGPLGGALTYTLASRARFDEVRLIDPSGTIAAGKALDVRQAGPPDGSSCRVSGHADVAAAAGAWVLVLADVLPREGKPPDEFATVRAAAAAAPGAVVVCAGAGHGALLPRLVGQGAAAPDLLVASAPAALAGAGRALIAAACDVSPREITVSMQPDADRPGGLAIDWSRTSLRGAPGDRVLPREARARLDDRLARIWPPGPLTLASAAARLTEAAWFGTRETCPAWVVDRTLAARCAPATGPLLVDLRLAPGGRLERAPGLGAVP